VTVLGDLRERELSAGDDCRDAWRPDRRIILDRARPQRLLEGAAAPSASTTVVTWSPLPTICAPILRAERRVKREGAVDLLGAVGVAVRTSPSSSISTRLREFSLRPLIQ